MVQGQGSQVLFRRHLSRASLLQQLTHVFHWTSKADRDEVALGVKRVYDPAMEEWQERHSGRRRHVCRQRAWDRWTLAYESVGGKMKLARPTDVQIDGFSRAEVRQGHKERSYDDRSVGELDQPFPVRPSRLGSEEHVESACICRRNKQRGKRKGLDGGLLRYRWQSRA